MFSLAEEHSWTQNIVKKQQQKISPYSPIPQENHELRLVELEKQCDSSRHIDKNAYGKNIILLHTM